MYLEQYLLSLYRKNFDQQMSSLSTMEGRLKSTSVMHKDIFGKVAGYDIMSEKEDSVIHSGHLMLPQNSNAKECNDIWRTRKLLDSSINRSDSSLSQHSACLTRASPPMKFLTKAVDSYHSLPLSMLEVTLYENISITLKWPLAFS